MFKFKCTRCGKDSFHPSQRLAVCCEDATMLQLANICLLVRKQDLPNHKLVAKSPESSVLEMIPNQEWVTACNATVKPRMVTGLPQAATCYKCSQWLESTRKTFQARQELDSLQEFMKTIDYEDEDNPENSIKAQVESVRKELPNSDIPMNVEDVDKLLTKIEELSKLSRQRKVLRNQLQLQQELKTL